MQFHGNLTEAGSTRRVRAALLVDEPGQSPQTLCLAREDDTPVVQVSVADVIPAIGGGDTRLRLASGDIFHLAASTDSRPLEPFFPETVQRGAVLARIEAVGWRGATILAVLFLLLIAGIRFSIAPAGDLLAQLVPPHIVERGSSMVLQQLDTLLFEESQLPVVEQDRIRADFETLLPLVPAKFHNTRLHFRSAPGIGPNAFALPGNDIVLLDELVDFADNDDVVLGVLAHELGHVVHQHALRSVTRGAVVAIGVSLLVGSQDSIFEEIAGFGSSLVLSRQSREFEAEADGMAQGWIREAGRDKQALITFLEKLAAECGAMCEGGSILDSHPSLADRISALEN
ncbi:MAG: M48 family metallopeptidase [Alphaproteobacteria bacterium]|nr:M48 family metallopeptidase [Alphaproteobacteria bacterium]